MTAVLVVTHMPAEGGAIKILGVYASEEAARAAIERAKAHAALGGHADFYWIDEYEVGKDDWLSW
ncbi:MAG: hypothetical protein KGJ78_07150 [Alphaproteobacteria bacterium]|nr:hypothetical protein [Alphaproteobacteria bacterium]